jgi:hypothetical protein
MPKSNTAALDVPELETVALLPAAVVVVVPAAIVAAVPGNPCLTRGAVADHTRAAVSLELTKAIENQTGFVGFVGGAEYHPVGAVPLLVTKLHDPPVGVAGAVADSWKINHSKYVPPNVVVFPYRPTVAMFFPYLKL